MPFYEHSQPGMSGVITPVSVLGAYGKDSANEMIGLGKAEHKTTGAMCDDINWLAGKRTLGVPYDRVKIQVSPINPRSIEAPERSRPRSSDTAKIVSDNIAAVPEEEGSETEVITAKDRGGRIDDHNGPGWKASR
jgi:hypothetical protein